jgi:hypothetical protein
MRLMLTGVFIVAAFAMAARSASATDLSQWFFTATDSQSSGPAAGKIRPDYLGGTSMRAEHCGADGVGIGGVWLLIKYDRKHRIGLAAASTDQCSVALFEAAPPGLNVPDADLSQYATGRGIRIGSSYGDVLSTYGGAPAKHGSHFVLRYTSAIADTTFGMPHKPIADDEILTIVIENDRVTSITSYIDLAGRY